MGTIIEIISCKCLKTEKNEDNPTKFIYKTEDTDKTPTKINLKMKTIL